MSGTTGGGARRRRPRKLTPHEQRIRWAEAGDVEAIWAVLAAARWDVIPDMEQVFSLLLRAIVVRAEKDPARFASETFTRMIGFNTYLLMRAQLYVNLRLGQHGRSTRALGRPDLSLAAVEPLIPGLLELQRALAETMAAQATTARAYELARAKRTENDRAEGVKAGAGRPAPRAHAHANGAAGAMGGGGQTSPAASTGLPGWLDIPNTNGAADDDHDDVFCSRVPGELERRWEALRAKLEAHADDLATRGALVSRVASGRKVWRVRLVVRAGGRRVHRAIYVGGDEVPELLERTRSLLEGYRLPRRWAEEVQGYARLAARAGGLVRRLAAGRGRPG